MVVEGIGGGCARKLGQAELAEILAQAGERIVGGRSDQVARVRNLGDASEVSLRNPASAFVSTVDVLYPVSADAELFGKISAVHALSDVYAVLGTPLWATVVIGLSMHDARAGAGGAFLSGILDGLVENDTALSGGHSVYTEPSMLSVTVCGLVTPVKLGTPRAGDALVLTKPIGSGIALSALRLELASEADLGEVYAAMEVSNRKASEALTAIAQENPEALRSTTDISGFGLIAAVRFVAHGTRARIKLSDVPVFSNVEMLAELGSASPLGDQNMLAADAHCTYEGAAGRTAFARVLLNDPQTSGGLLLAIDPPLLQRLNGDLREGVDYWRIGELEHSGEHDEIQVVVEA